MPNNLSSRTLFHYAKDLDTLKAILINGLRFSTIGEVIPGTTPKLSYFVEAISFCDIPLSKTDEHIDWYGSYGLGLKASFCKSLGATPVQYVHPKSSYLKHRGIDTMHFYQSYPGTPFIKRIYGAQKFKGGLYRMKYFYNEKEWRIVNMANEKDLTIYDNTMTLAEIDQLAADYNEGAEHRNYIPEPRTSPIPTPETEINPRLKYGLPIEEIEYIILEHKREIPSFTLWLRQTFSNVDELLPKIVTCDKIRKDF